MNVKKVLPLPGNKKPENSIDSEMLPQQLAVLLDKIKVKRPVLAKIISDSGNRTLSDYDRMFFHQETDPIQPRLELIDLVVEKANQLLGSDIAQKVRNELISNPVLLTGNHHCPNYMPISLQASILFALSKKKNSIVPILACADIPLNNSEHPRGIITTAGVKINIYSDKDKHRLVSCTFPFTAEMILHTCQKVKKLYREGTIDEKEKNVILNLLEKDYLSNEVLNQKNYSHQTTILNQKLWKRLFVPESYEQMPEIVFLEMEDIVGNLLQNDLRSNKTFFKEIFFNQALRKTLLRRLDGIYGCWDLKRLVLLHNPLLTYEEKTSLMQHVGTVFFWGIDKKGRRFSLQLMETKKGEQLYGRDDSGVFHTFNFTPETVCKYLDDKSLLPCLFTSYTSIAFVRGFTCYGGFMQTDYLTAMRRGLAMALKEQGFHVWAQKVASVPTEKYITGIIHTITRKKETDIYPAGALDFIRKGGLTKSDVGKITSLTLAEGNIFGIKYMYNALYNEKLDNSTLQKIFTTIPKTILDKFVVIS